MANTYYQDILPQSKAHLEHKFQRTTWKSNGKSIKWQGEMILPMDENPQHFATFLILYIQLENLSIIISFSEVIADLNLLKLSDCS